MRVRLFATPVQGPLAAVSIAEAIAKADRLAPDVIALVRGGGSDEDRLPFNEEIVARALVAADTPVVTAIGHSADHHIADDVADVAYATPTAAATALAAGFVASPRLFFDAGSARTRAGATPHRRDDGTHCGGCARRRPCSASSASAMRSPSAPTGWCRTIAARHAAALHRRVDRLRDLERRLATTIRALGSRSARGRLDVAASSIAGAWTARATRAARDSTTPVARLTPATRAMLERMRVRVELLRARLAGKDPEAILQQGYAIVRIGDRVLKDAARAHTGDAIEARLWRGTIRARVEETQGDG